MPAKQSQPPAPDSVARHARQTRRQIVLPVLAGVLLIALLVAVVLVLPQRLQVSTVSDFLVIVFMLCPAAICMLPLTILMLIAALGVGRLHDRAAPPLRGLQTRTAAITGQVESAADAVNRQAVTYGARLGAVLRVLDVFEYPQPAATTDGKDNDERNTETDRRNGNREKLEDTDLRDGHGRGSAVRPAGGFSLRARRRRGSAAQRGETRGDSDSAADRPAAVSARIDPSDRRGG